jgi:hypothetical protein
MNWKDAAQRLEKDPAAAQAAMQSPDGQALLHLLSASDGGKALQNAATRAAGGDVSELSRLLKEALSTDEGAALADRLGKQFK